MLTPATKIRGVCVGASGDCVFVVTNGQLKRMTPDLQRCQRAVHLDLPLLDRDYGILRPICRPMRRGVISGCLGQQMLFLWTRRRLMLFDRFNLESRGTFELGSIGRPLLGTAARYDGADAFYFGEYISNPARRKVAILRLTEKGIEVVGEIPDGKIEHIHNILVESESRLIVFAGDFDNAASIWRLHLVGGQLERLAYGDQNYRTSSAIRQRQMLIYATDTTSKANSLRRFDLTTGEEEKLADLPASSIYSAADNMLLAFSTNLEAALETKGNFWSKWLTTRTPDVFETDRVHIYLYDTRGLKELFSVRPSRLPYRLFQYPSFRLHLSSHAIYASATSVAGLDHCIIRFQR